MTIDLNSARIQDAIKFWASPSVRKVGLFWPSDHHGQFYLHTGLCQHVYTREEVELITAHVLVAYALD